MATEVKQRNNRAFIFLGVLLAAGAFALSLYLSQRNTGGAAPSGPTVAVVYTTQDVAKGTRLDATMLTVKHVPADSVPATAIPDPTGAVGKFTAIPVSANSPLVAAQLVADQSSSQTAALAVQPLDIAKGNVAMAIPVAWPSSDPFRTSDLVGVGNYIHDDDHIDILVDPNGGGTVRYAFQDVRVLKVGTSASAATAAPTVLVVEVSRAQAEQLAFLMTNKGSAQVVKYVLRAHDDAGKTTGANQVGGEAPADQSTFNRLFPAAH